MMNKIIKHLVYVSLASIWLFAASHGIAQQKEFLSIDSSYAMAKRNYPLIKQFDLIEKTEEYTISNANKAYFPQFNITVIGGVMDGFPDLSPDGSGGGVETKLIGFAQLNQVIWDGGFTKAKKEIALANTEVEKANLEVQLFAIHERVNQIFFGLLLIDEQIQQMNIMVENLHRSLKSVKTAYENGTVYKSDVQEVAVEILNIEQKISELIYTKKAYVSMFELMIGKSLENIHLEKPSADALVLGVENSRPELILFENQKKLVEAQSRIVNARLYPKFGLMGVGAFFTPGLSFGPADLNHILLGGLSLSWDIGGLYTKNNDKQLIQIKSQGVDIQKETFLFSNSIQFNQNNNELLKYQSMLARDRELLDLKSSIRESYEVKYENGVCTMSDLLRRMNDESIARQTLILHELQYQMCISQIKFIQGK